MTTLRQLSRFRWQWRAFAWKGNSFAEIASGTALTRGWAIRKSRASRGF